MSHTASFWGDTFTNMNSRTPAKDTLVRSISVTSFASYQGDRAAHDLLSLSHRSDQPYSSCSWRPATWKHVGGSHAGASYIQRACRPASAGEGLHTRGQGEATVLPARHRINPVQHGLALPRAPWYPADRETTVLPRRGAAAQFAGKPAGGPQKRLKGENVSVWVRHRH